ncbi:PTS glucitol/sorbitol transporter subunit IIA [Streptococcus sp. H49]|uniref:PTS glucitol/sorbitol transporter subunit IIA n=1 Tax=Streptococcus huangxiaojuni TaxID=3237239 RepID=UPI0034A2EF54
MPEFKVVEIGEMVPDFAEEMLLVLFGESAPPELRMISVIHDYQANQKNVLKTGTRLVMGKQTYTVTKVGSAANANFEELGHVAIYFREGNSDILPGSITARPVVFPKLKAGDSIQIINE